MVMPKFGNGSLAGMPISDSQGFGIPTKGKNHESRGAAARVHALAGAGGGDVDHLQADPGQHDFDGARSTSRSSRTVHENWIAADHDEYIADLMPTKFWTDAMFVASQKILAGSMTGAEAGDLAAKVTETWKKQNPDMVEQLQDLGRRTSERELNAARCRPRLDAAHPPLGPVPVRRTGGRAAVPRLRLPARPRGRLLARG